MRRRARPGLLRCGGVTRGCLWHGTCMRGAEVHFVRSDFVLLGGLRVKWSRKCSNMACVGCITLLLVEFGLDSVVLGSYVIGVSVRAMVKADDEVCSSHSRA